MSLIARFKGQHAAHLRPAGPRWALCWPDKLCYLGVIQWMVQSRHQICVAVIEAPGGSNTRYSCGAQLLLSYVYCCYYQYKYLDLCFYDCVEDAYDKIKLWDRFPHLEHAQYLRESLSPKTYYSVFGWFKHIERPITFAQPYTSWANSQMILNGFI